MFFLLSFSLRDVSDTWVVGQRHTRQDDASRGFDTLTRFASTTERDLAVVRLKHCRAWSIEFEYASYSSCTIYMLLCVVKLMQVEHSEWPHTLRYRYVGCTHPPKCTHYCRGKKSQGGSTFSVSCKLQQLSSRRSSSELSTTWRFFHISLDRETRSETQLEAFATHRGARTTRNTLDQIYPSTYRIHKLWKSLIYSTSHLSPLHFLYHDLLRRLPFSLTTIHSVSHGGSNHSCPHLPKTASSGIRIPSESKRSSFSQTFFFRE